MTTTTTAAPRPAAQRVTDILEPRTWIIATIALLGWGADRLAGLGWAALIALFAAVMPMAFIKYGMRRWGWSDRHVGVREHRLAAFAFIIASVAAGLALLLILGAPHKMTGYITGMLAGVLALTAITVKWKISVHCAVASGGVLIVALTFSPWILLGYALVALVAWSRVELRDHTPAQVIAGTVLGAVIAMAITSALSLL